MISSRVFYAIREGFKQKKRLSSFLKEQSLSSKKLIDIDDSRLLKFKVIILDFDGVMAGHGAPYPEREVEQWLRGLSAKLSYNRICILSNKPLPVRRQYFEKHFPHIEFIKAPKKKPYPDGLKLIAQKLQCLPEDMVLVDDRILTGCLASVLAGAQGILITKPYYRFAKRPLSEAWFVLLRSVEKWLL